MDEEKLSFKPQQARLLKPISPQNVCKIKGFGECFKMGNRKILAPGGNHAGV